MKDYLKAEYNAVIYWWSAEKLILLDVGPLGSKHNDNLLGKTFKIKITENMEISICGLWLDGHKNKSYDNGKNI